MKEVTSSLLSKITLTDGEKQNQESTAAEFPEEFELSQFINDFLQLRYAEAQPAFSVDDDEAIAA